MNIIESPAVDMAPVRLDLDNHEKVDARAASLASAADRGKPNIEDQLRAALELVGGLKVLGDPAAEKWEEAIAGALRESQSKSSRRSRLLSPHLVTRIRMVWE